MKQEVIYATKNSIYVKMMKITFDDGHIQYAFMNKISDNIVNFFEKHPTEFPMKWIADEFALNIDHELTFPSGLYFGQPINKCTDVFYMIRYMYETPDLPVEVQTLVSDRLSQLNCLYLYGRWYNRLDSLTTQSYIVSKMDKLAKCEPIMFTFHGGLNDFAVGIPEEFDLQVHFPYFTSELDSTRTLHTYVYPSPVSSRRYVIGRGTPYMINKYHFKDDVLIVDEFGDLPTSC